MKPVDTLSDGTPPLLYSIRLANRRHIEWRVLRPLEEVLVNAGPIGIAILSGADDGILAYTHACHTQSLVLLYPPCLASIPLWRLDIVACFNVVVCLPCLSRKYELVGLLFQDPSPRCDRHHERHCFLSEFLEP